MTSQKHISKNKWIENPDDINSNPLINLLIYDDDCNLCTSLVSLFRRKNKHKSVLLVPLHSHKGQSILKKLKPQYQQLDSLVLIYKGQVYFKSTAALLLTREMGSFWKIGVLFLLIPKSWRDFIYDYIAKNRLRWFGKKSSCSHTDREGIFDKN